MHKDNKFTIFFVDYGGSDPAVTFVKPCTRTYSNVHPEIQDFVKLQYLKIKINMVVKLPVQHFLSYLFLSTVQLIFTGK